MLLMAAAEGGWILRARQIGMDVDHIATRIAPLLSVSVAIQTAMIAVGVYGPEALQSIRFDGMQFRRDIGHRARKG